MIPASGERPSDSGDPGRSLLRGDAPTPATLTADAVRTVVLYAALGTVLVGIFARAAASRGFYWEDDYSHLQISRLALQDPRWLLNVWGRPLMTLAYMPAVMFGETAVRLTSLLLLVIAACLCTAIARQNEMPLPAAGALFLLAQPLAAEIGYSALPYTIFSFVLAVALWLRSSGRHAWAAVVASLLPLARLEGLVVLAVWAITLTRERRFPACALLGVGVALWNTAGALVYGDALWLWHANPYGFLGSRYEAAGWTYVLSAFPKATGPVICLLAVMGLVVKPTRDRLAAHLAIGLLAFYAAVWGLPAFQSFGDPVYLVTASVPIALCALGGLLVLDRGRAVVGMSLRLPHVQRLLAMAVIIASTTASLGLTRSLPLRWWPRLSREIASELGPRGADVLLWSDPAFGWFVRARHLGNNWSDLPHVPVGGLVLWDSFLGPEAGISEERIRQVGFEPLRDLREGRARVVLWVRATSDR